MNRILSTCTTRLALILCLSFSAIQAQTTAFTYQGRLTDGGNTANGLYDLQFKLFDAATAGNQVGATIARDDVSVTGGVFSTSLDFGATAFPGAARWLEISLRPGASTGAYTTLTPRQQVNSTPYAIRALSAETVTGPVPASQITGTLPPSALPAGGSYINNSTTQQASSNFNISGNGTAGGTLSGNVVNTATQYNLGGQRILIADSQRSNVFAGLSSGAANTTGSSNAFFGIEAGAANTIGNRNSFFGNFAGTSNMGGRFNAFFGDSAGRNNTGGEGNAFFGSAAGGSNTTGSGNAFFGEGAGGGNTTASLNSVFGFRAGQNNRTDDENSYFGAYAGLNSSGFGNSFFGSLAGANASLTSYNSFFGRNAGNKTSNASYNAFFGAEAGSANTNGRNNAFFGSYSGAVNTMGANNTFIGYSSAPQHATGDYNTFVGYAGGLTQTSGSNNTLLGANANVSQPNLSYATAIGAGATVYNSNNIALGRNVDTVTIYGGFRITPLQSSPAGSQRQLCVDSNASVIWCASSQRYKTNVQPLRNGLSVVNRLRPVTFDWKSNGAPDLGFIAEEVAEVEPLLAFRNANGQIEGVNYNQVSAVLVNAVREQQSQIEQQQKQIKQQQAELAQLKQLVCATQPQAAVCQPKP